MSVELSRRSFIKKSTAAVAATGIGAAGLFSYTNWFEKADAAENPADNETIRYMWHSSSCLGDCSLKCTVRDGRLSLLEPNDTPAIKDRSVMCARGISEIQNIYGTGRLQTPLKRVGERYSGEFVAISWDEALDEVEKNIKEITQKHGEYSFLYADKSMAYGAYNWLVAMAGLQIPGTAGVDCGISNGYSPAINISYGTAEIMDVMNAETLLILGTNNLETDLAKAWFWFDVKESGTKIISIDPNYSAVSVKAHQWIPIEPGTDSALLLSMISLVIDNEWYDEEFLLKNTSLPFLVQVDNGKLLRQSEPNSEDVDSTKGANNPFFVWDDVSKSPQPYQTEGVIPALEGEFTFEGKKYTTAFSLLKENQKEYTVDWASSITGIDPIVIYDLTKQYATAGPGFILNAWGGPDKYTNADICGHAMIVLIGLTGNIGKPGSGFLNGGYFMYPGLFAGSWQLPLGKYPGGKALAGMLDLRSGETNVKGIFAFGNPFQQLFINNGDTLKWLEDIEFIAVVDVYNSASVQYADIVLPACSFFECEEEIHTLTITKDRLMVRQKVIEPLFDSKTDYQIQYELCSRFGDVNDLPKSREELVRFGLANSFSPVIQNISLEDLIANQCAMTLEGAMVRPNRLLEDQVYDTASGKLDLYYEQLLEFNQAFPVFEYPNEASPESPLREKYPLVFMNLKGKYRAQSRFFFAEWINEIVYPEAEMNPVDAAARNIVTGDAIEVFNDRGSFQITVRVNPSIRPGVIKTDAGVNSKNLIKGSINDVVSNHMIPRAKHLVNGQNPCYYDTLVEARKVGE